MILGLCGCLGAQGYPEARVWRDHTGVPHIESSSELGLFHAEGYLQAADQLPWIAYNALAMTGRLAETFGPGPRNEAFIFPESHVLNDSRSSDVTCASSEQADNGSVNARRPCRSRHADQDSISDWKRSNSWRSASLAPACSHKPSYQRPR